MSNIILLAETGSDIPAEFAKQYGIYTVPMHVAFGDESRDDGTFPISDIYHFFETTGTLTKTSGCTVGDFERIFDDIQAAHPGKHILHLAYSAVTTCSYHSCELAIEGKPYAKNVRIVDTKHISVGQCAVVVAVKE